jgi:hypothetical protein
MQLDKLQEIVVEDEDRDAWRLFLARGDYASALKHCDDAAARVHIVNVQADAAFACGDFGTFYRKFVFSPFFFLIAFHPFSVL